MTDNGKLRIEYMKLDEFISRFHPANPKDHDIGAIGTMMAKFGFKNLPGIDENTGLLAYGHGRGKTLLANMKAGNPAPDDIHVGEDGMWSLPVVRGLTFDSPEELRAYLVADNRATELGGWDESKLAELLTETAEFDTELFEATGYDNIDVADMMSEFVPEEESAPTFSESNFKCPECGHEWSEM